MRALVDGVAHGTSMERPCVPSAKPWNKVNVIPTLMRCRSRTRNYQHGPKTRARGAPNPANALSGNEPTSTNILGKEVAPTGEILFIFTDEVCGAPQSNLLVTTA